MIHNIALFMIGLMLGNALEYGVHKYLFHGLGKKKKSIFSFHLRDHHLVSRANQFVDKRLSKIELIGGPILLLLHLPLLFLAPAIYFGMAAYAITFFVVHNYQHRHPEFTKKYFPWLWNHHMKNQNKSWGVVLPLMDILTGTLEKDS